MRRHGIVVRLALLLFVSSQFLQPATPSEQTSQAADRVKSQPPLRLIYRTVVLPTGHVGIAYGPKRVVEGGVPPYSFELTGKFPAGLTLGADGMLVGTPVTLGSYGFQLVVRDSSVQSPVVTQQPYVLRIEANKAPAPNPSVTLTREEAEATVNPNPEAPVTYLLTLDALKSAVMQGLVTPQQLEAVVAPVIDVEYPSLFLYKAALEAARCAYYRKALLQGAVGKSPIDLTCPPPPQAGAPSVLTLREYYDQLLPDTVRVSLVDAAERYHPLNGSLPPNLMGNGCGCAPRNRQDEVYGFYPFWDATSASQPIDFSLFTRIAYMGVVLNPSGDYTTPPNWLDQSGNFARTVHRFDTRLDLVVYRHEWSWLLALSEKQIRALAEQAARTAVTMIDTPLDGPFALKPFWLPFWRESAHAYDGITVFFDYPGDRSRFNAAGVEKFQLFLSEYLRQAASAMQRSGRAYNLNIVVPDDLIVDDGPFSYRNLINYIELAEPATTRKGTAAEDDFAYYKGTSPITVDLLVLMREPTSMQKKLLRAGIDQLTAPYDGHRRVALLQSMVPVSFHRGGPQRGSPADLHGSDLDKNLAYQQWTYGGVGFWPVPIATLGDGVALNSVLRKDFFATTAATGVESEITTASATLCRFVCPNRNLVRLLFELLILISLGLGGAHLVNCRSSRIYLALLISSALAVTCGSLLLSCDPTLYELKQGNLLLLGLIVGLGLFIVYKSYKPQVARP